MAAGVAGLPEGNNSNGCDTKTGPNDPAESLTNPRHCHTFRAGFIALFIVALAAIAAWLVFTPDPAPRLFLFSRPQIMHMDDAMMKLWLVLRVLNEVTTSIGQLSPATGGATLFQNVRIFSGILIVNRVPLQM